MKAYDFNDRATFWFVSREDREQCQNLVYSSDHAAETYSLSLFMTPHARMYKFGTSSRVVNLLAVIYKLERCRQCVQLIVSGTLLVPLKVEEDFLV
jgi:hypothetical protein